MSGEQLHQPSFPIFKTSDFDELMARSAGPLKAIREKSVALKTQTTSQKDESDGSVDKTEAREILEREIGFAAIVIADRLAIQSGDEFLNGGQIEKRIKGLEKEKQLLTVPPVENDRPNKMSTGRKVPSAVTKAPGVWTKDKELSLSSGRAQLNQIRQAAREIVMNEFNIASLRTAEMDRNAVGSSANAAMKAAAE